MLYSVQKRWSTDFKALNFDMIGRVASVLVVIYLFLFGYTWGSFAETDIVELGSPGSLFRRGMRKIKCQCFFEILSVFCFAPYLWDWRSVWNSILSFFCVANKRDLMLSLSMRARMECKYCLARWNSLLGYFRDCLTEVIFSQNVNKRLCLFYLEFENRINSLSKKEFSTPEIYY